MKRQHTLLTTIVAVALGTMALGTPGTSVAQALIHACVDNTKGTLRIVSPGTACTSKESLITWPAESIGGVSYYQRSAAAQLVTIPMTVVALCDASEDTATGGGYRWEPNPNVSVFTSCWIEASASCRASGLCSGPAGEDGWVVTAWSCTSTTSQVSTMHVYVTCSQPTE